MIAARADSPDNISALLQAGAEPDVADSERGLTALHLALASDGWKTVESVGELLVAGADPGKPAKDG